uniref:PRL2-8 n=1 Tax=Streptomyces sp. NBC_00008 TaxID=2903610 RepID=A0AAU2VU74_9ACTN
MIIYEQKLLSNSLERARARAHAHRNECPACGERFSGNALEFTTPPESP